MLSLSLSFACHTASAPKRFASASISRPAPSSKSLSSKYAMSTPASRWGPGKQLRRFSAKSHASPPPQSASSMGNSMGTAFNLTAEQYAELKEQRVPLDFQYKTYTEEPAREEADAIFEPKHIDLVSITELMARKRHTAAIKRANEVLEPHRSVIQSGYPAHDPSINESLRQELSECLGLLSMCYLHQDEFDLAIDASMGATNICPNSENFSDLASNLLTVGRYEDAIRAAERSIELDPYKEVDALITKAYAIWKLQAFDRGYDLIGLCDLALSRDPYATTALEVKAEYLAHQGKLHEAVKVIERAIAKDDDNFHLTQVKVKFLERLGLYPLAMTALLKFAKENPDEPGTHRDIARIALLSSEWKIAILNLKKMIEEAEQPVTTTSKKSKKPKPDSEREIMVDTEAKKDSEIVVVTDAPYADLAHALGMDRQLDDAYKYLEKAIASGNTASIAFETPYHFSNMKRSFTIKRKNDAAAAASQASS